MLLRFVFQNRKVSFGFGFKTLYNSDHFYILYIARGTARIYCICAYIYILYIVYLRDSRGNTHFGKHKTNTSSASTSLSSEDIVLPDICFRCNGFYLQTTIFLCGDPSCSAYSYAYHPVQLFPMESWYHLS